MIELVESNNNKTLTITTINNNFIGVIRFLGYDSLGLSVFDRIFDGFNLKEFEEAKTAATLWEISR